MRTQRNLAAVVVLGPVIVSAHQLGDNGVTRVTLMREGYPTRMAASDCSHEKAVAAIAEICTAWHAGVAVADLLWLKRRFGPDVEQFLPQEGELS